MPINKETILSVYDDKLTLMQWLKTINKALDEAVLTGVEVRQKGNATFSFVVTFEDGTKLESNEFVLAQGESVANAYIQNGHLYLTLTNGTNLDAGDVKPVSNFSIDTNQHLIVNYEDGTNQDLGAIFQGNVNISGTLNATKVTGNEIVEKMTGYRYYYPSSEPAVERNVTYAGVVKNGNKLTMVIAQEITRIDTISNDILILGTIGVPAEIGQKLYPVNNAWLAFINVYCASNYNAGITLNALAIKDNVNSVRFAMYSANSLNLNTKYYIRVELTFLLSDNLAQ